MEKCVKDGCVNKRQARTMWCWEHMSSWTRSFMLKGKPAPKNEPLNRHHPDCDAPEEPYHNYMCSELCPLQYNLGGLAVEE